MLITRNESHLVIIDFQEKLVHAICDSETLIKNAAILLEAAHELEVPVTASEQYRAGLGPTVSSLAEHLEPGATIEKVEFSCVRNAELAARLSKADRMQFVLCGVEGHICVLQTALELKAGGAQVFVVTDAVGTRRPESKEIALRRMAGAGIVPVTTEMVLFEWLQSAAAPAFRRVSRLIR